MKLKILCYSISCLCLGGLSARAQVSLNPSPSRELGQPSATFSPLNTAPLSASPNYVEGRELYLPLINPNLATGGVAIDNNASPPIVYVSDTGNNRILGWNYSDSLGRPSSGAFPPADYVIGQVDRFSTFAQDARGNGNGLALPTGLAVDSAGNLYVVDSGNNRILRFPRYQTTPDLVIGQFDLNHNLGNQGQATPSEGTINLGNTAPAGLAVDANDNLYFTDVGNNRVLRYARSDLRAGNNGLPATLVLGQNSFNSAVQGNRQTGTTITLGQLAQPVGVAVDSQGRVYVADRLSRILVFPANATSGSSATAVAGYLAQTNPPPTQAVQSATVVNNPIGVFVMPDGRVGVVDSAFSRVIMFPAVSSWPSPQAATPSPQALSGGVIPASNLDTTSVTLSHYQNGGNSEASATTLNWPTFAAYNSKTSELFVVDAGNHRILALPQQGNSFGTATRVLGQDQFEFMSPNLIEGREFQFNPGTTPYIAGMAIDQNNHLYVADTYNNRILGFRDVRAFKTGQPADLVIGQRDMRRGVCNYNSNSTAIQTAPNASSLCLPAGLALDSAGNLWVADYGNSRVLRFDAPFNVGPLTLQSASVVIGQGGSFNTRTAGPANFGRQVGNGPYGLAMDTDSRLIVSDPSLNRVLIYSNTNGNWVRTTVLGQTNPTACPAAGCAAGRGNDQLSAPVGIATDSGGFLYVADSGNGRVQIFANTQFLANGDSATSYSLTGLSGPSAVYVNGGHGTATEFMQPRSTGEIWVADRNFAIRYPDLGTIQSSPQQGNIQPTFVTTEAFNTLAVAQDQFGNLYVADATNRIVSHYPALIAVNTATMLIPSGSSSAYPLAPGMLASICPPPQFQNQTQACRPDDPSQFGAQSGVNTDLPNPYPLPTTLADIQVLLNGNPVPLINVQPQQINFQVPMSAQRGAATLEVVQVSTGQTLGSYPARIVQFLPALFRADPPVHTVNSPDTCGGLNGICYQALVTNADGSMNSPTNPAARGSSISLFGTGQGFVDNAPADGDLTPDSQIPTAWKPRVILGTQFVDDSVTYSGLAPGMLGIWRIDLTIPATVAPGNNIVAVTTPDTSTSAVRGVLQLTVSVKQSQ